MKNFRLVLLVLVVAMLFVGCAQRPQPQPEPQPPEAITFNAVTINQAGTVITVVLSRAPAEELDKTFFKVLVDGQARDFDHAKVTTSERGVTGHQLTLKAGLTTTADLMVIGQKPPIEGAAGTVTWTAPPTPDKPSIVDLTISERKNLLVLLDKSPTTALSASDFAVYADGESLVFVYDGALATERGSTIHKLVLENELLADATLIVAGKNNLAGTVTKDYQVPVEPPAEEDPSIVDLTISGNDTLLVVLNKAPLEALTAGNFSVFGNAVARTFTYGGLLAPTIHTLELADALDEDTTIIVTGKDGLQGTVTKEYVAPPPPPVELPVITGLEILSNVALFVELDKEPANELNPADFVLYVNGAVKVINSVEHIVGTTDVRLGLDIHNPLTHRASVRVDGSNDLVAGSRSQVYMSAEAVDQAVDGTFNAITVFASRGELEERSVLGIIQIGGEWYEFSDRNLMFWMESKFSNQTMAFLRIVVGLDDNGKVNSLREVYLPAGTYQYDFQDLITAITYGMPYSPRNLRLIGGDGVEGQRTEIMPIGLNPPNTTTIGREIAGLLPTDAHNGWVFEQFLFRGNVVINSAFTTFNHNRFMGQLLITQSAFRSNFGTNIMEQTTTVSAEIVAFTENRFNSGVLIQNNDVTFTGDRFTNALNIDPASVGLRSRFTNVTFDLAVVFPAGLGAPARANSVAIQGCTFTGNLTVNARFATLTDNLVYAGTTTIGADDVQLTQANTITYRSTAPPAAALVVNGNRFQMTNGANATFDGAVTVTGNNATIATTGNADFVGAVLLNGNAATVQTGGNLILRSTLGIGGNTARVLTAGNGTFTGAVTIGGANARIITDGTGTFLATVTINGHSASLALATVIHNGLGGRFAGVVTIAGNFAHITAPVLPPASGSRQLFGNLFEANLIITGNDARIQNGHFMNGVTVTINGNRATFWAGSFQLNSQIDPASVGNNATFGFDGEPVRLDHGVLFRPNMTFPAGMGWVRVYDGDFRGNVTTTVPGTGQVHPLDDISTDFIRGNINGFIYAAHYTYFNSIVFQVPFAGTHAGSGIVNNRLIFNSCTFEGNVQVYGTNTQFNSHNRFKKVFTIMPGATGNRIEGVNIFEGKATFNEFTVVENGPRFYSDVTVNRWQEEDHGFFFFRDVNFRAPTATSRQTVKLYVPTWFENISFTQEGIFEPGGLSQTIVEADSQGVYADVIMVFEGTIAGNPALYNTSGSRDILDEMHGTTKIISLNGIDDPIRYQDEVVMSHLIIETDVPVSARFLTDNNSRTEGATFRDVIFVDENNPNRVTGANNTFVDVRFLRNIAGGMPTFWVYGNGNTFTNVYFGSHLVIGDLVNVANGNTFTNAAPLIGNLGYVGQLGYQGIEGDLTIARGTAAAPNRLTDVPVGGSVTITGDSNLLTRVNAGTFGLITGTGNTWNGTTIGTSLTIGDGVGTNGRGTTIDNMTIGQDLFINVVPAANGVGAPLIRDSIVTRNLVATAATWARYIRVEFRQALGANDLTLANTSRNARFEDCDFHSNVIVTDAPIRFGTLAGAGNRFRNNLTIAIAANSGVTDELVFYNSNFSRTLPVSPVVRMDSSISSFANPYRVYFHNVQIASSTLRFVPAQGVIRLNGEIQNESDANFELGNSDANFIEADIKTTTFAVGNHVNPGMGGSWPTHVRQIDVLNQLPQ